MRLSLILIMVLVVVFGMISCDRQRAVDEKKLSLAEELMPDNPDSAYKLLNDILFPEIWMPGRERDMPDYMQSQRVLPTSRLVPILFLKVLRITIFQWEIRLVRHQA